MTDRPIIFSAPMVRALLDGRKAQTRRLLNPQPPEWATYCEQPEMLNALGHWVPSGLWRWSEPEQMPLRKLRQWPVDAAGEHYWMRPRWEAGDRLYVREAFRLFADIGDDCEVTYLADGRRWQTGPRAGDFGDLALPSYFKMIDSVRKRSENAGSAAAGYPSIHMPRWASRLTLTVTDVRFERLTAISRADAIAEGIQRIGGGMLRWENWSGAEGQSAPTPEAAYALLWESLHGAGSWDANPWVVAVSFSVERGNIDQIARAA